MSQKSADYAIVRFDYNATSDCELNIRKGEQLTVLDDSRNWWQVMNTAGKTGYIPSNYVKRSKQGIFSSLRNTLGRRKSRQDNSTSNRPSNPSSPTPDNNCGYNLNNPKHESIESIGSKGGGNTTGSSDALPMNQNFANMRLHEPVPDTYPYSFDSHSSITPQTQHVDITKGLNQQSNNALSKSDVLQTYSQPTNGENFLISNQNGHNSNDGDNKLNSSTIPSIQQTNLFAGNADISASSYYGTGTTGFGRQVCQARFRYPACQPDELSIERGDKIRVLEKSSDGWWRGVLITESKPQRIGWFPSNYVTLDLSKNLNRTGSSSQPSILNSTVIGRDTPFDTSATFDVAKHHQTQGQAQMLAHEFYNANQKQYNPNVLNARATKISDEPYRPCETVLTLYPFVRNQPEELSFSAKEMLEVIEKPPDDPDWWRCRNSHGEVGLVPQNYVQVLSDPVLHTPQSSQVGMIDCKVVPNRTMTPLQQQQQQQQCTDGEMLRLSYAARSNTGRIHMGRPWCWGVISRAECETMLGQFSLPGEFIVRDSESHPGDLTITINAGSKTRNFKVHLDQNGQYHIGQKMFNCIDDLIEHYRTHPIFKNEQEKHYLTRPFVHPGPSEASRSLIPPCQPNFISNTGTYSQSIPNTHGRYG